MSTSVNGIILYYFSEMSEIASGHSQSTRKTEINRHVASLVASLVKTRILRERQKKIRHVASLVSSIRCRYNPKA